MEKKEMRKNVLIDLDGQEFKLQTCLVGGQMDSDPPYPIAFYAGKLALEDMGMALLHAFRAVIKIQTDVHEFTVVESADFIRFCLDEAVTRELKRAERNDDESDTVFRMTKHNG